MLFPILSTCLIENLVDTQLAFDLLTRVLFFLFETKSRADDTEKEQDTASV